MLKIFCLDCDADILEKMPPQYLDNPSSIDGKAKDMISKASGKHIDDVAKMMMLYGHSVVVAKWVAMK